MSKEFLYTNWRCRTIYNKRLLSRIITDKIRLLLPSSPSSCSSSACANNSYYTVFQTLDNVVDEDWDGHRNIRNKLRFSGVVCFVKFTCSCWMPRAFFINWFANVVASWLLATSTPSHRVTFACGVSRCMPVTLPNQFYAQRFRC